MENHTIIQLKAIAKERGIKGYYKLRKAELIHALEATRLEEQKSNIFDEPIPNDPTSIFQPTLWGSSNIVTKVKQNIKNFTAKSMEKINDFGNWFLNYIPPKPKLVNKLLESFKNKIKKMYEKTDTLFQPIQSKSALTNFAIQYRVEGINGYDPESFLLNSKQPITYDQHTTD